MRPIYCFGVLEEKLLVGVSGRRASAHVNH